MYLYKKFLGYLISVICITYVYKILILFLKTRKIIPLIQRMKNDKYSKIEEASTTSTTDNSPLTEKNISEPVLDDKLKEYEGKIQKLSEFVLKLKNLLEKKTNDYDQKVK